jgi:hypothetical protein
MATHRPRHKRQQQSNPAPVQFFVLEPGEPDRVERAPSPADCPLPAKAASNATLDDGWKVVGAGRRRSTKSDKAVRQFVKAFIATTKAAGRHPTLEGLQTVGRDAGMSRQRLRVVYHEIIGDEVKRGRPRKFPK